MKFYCKMCDKEWDKRQLLKQLRCPKCMKYCSPNSKEDFELRAMLRLKALQRLNKGELSMDELMKLQLTKSL